MFLNLKKYSIQKKNSPLELISFLFTVKIDTKFITIAKLEEYQKMYKFEFYIFCETFFLILNYITQLLM